MESLDVFLQLGWEFAGEGAEVLAQQGCALERRHHSRGSDRDICWCWRRNTPELKDKIAALAPGFDPQALLAHVRRATLELSVERPDLAAAVVRSAAIARSPAGRSRERSLRRVRLDHGSRVREIHGAEQEAGRHRWNRGGVGASAGHFRFADSVSRAATQPASRRSRSPRPSRK